MSKFNLSFKEAIFLMRKHIPCISVINPDVVQILKNDMYYCADILGNKIDGEYTPTFISHEEENCQWRIFLQSEACQDDIIDRDTDENSHYFEVESDCIFNNEIECDDWKYAFEVLIELKLHPLSKKLDQEKEQYYIHPTINFSDIKTFSLQSTFWKIGVIGSAFFNSPEDARKAINDIGAHKILSMFKIFAGMNKYE